MRRKKSYEWHVNLVSHSKEFLMLIHYIHACILTHTQILTPYLESPINLHVITIPSRGMSPAILKLALNHFHLIFIYEALPNHNRCHCRALERYSLNQTNCNSVCCNAILIQSNQIHQNPNSNPIHSFMKKQGPFLSKPTDWIKTSLWFKLPSLECMRGRWKGEYIW